MNSALPWIAAACLLPAPCLHSQDVLKLGSGKTIKGNVLRLGAKEITIEEQPGKPQVFANDEVESLVLGDFPAGVDQGNLALSARDWKKALAAYRSALDEVERGKSREIHRDSILLQIARAQRGQGDLDGALKTLETLRGGCADCRLRREAFTESIACARRKKDRAALEKVLGEMEAAPEPLAGQAQLERARTQFEASEFAGARKVFRRLAQNHGQPYVPDAVLGDLRCRFAQKKSEADSVEIEAACKAALDQRMESSVSLEQGAASLLGEILLQKSGEDREKLREAVLACARAISAGPPSREDGEEDYLRALVNAARGAVLLSRAAGAAEGIEEGRRRAAGYYREILRSSPQSEWARIAGEELNRLDPREKARG